MIIAKLSRGKAMKAFEVMATLNDKQHLLLDDSLDIDTPIRVKVIVLVSDEFVSNENEIEEITDHH